MFKLHGTYEWSLVDKDSGEVIESGVQNNLINERLMWILTRNDMSFSDITTSNKTGVEYFLYMAIQLSGDVPSPSVEYREYNTPRAFNILVEDSEDFALVDMTTNTAYTQHNFGPPVSPRTIRTIGVKCRHRYVTANPSYDNFVSFIELTTPVTQQTNQYFFVKYSLGFELDMGGDYAPSTRYHSYPLEKYFWYGGSNLLGYSGTSSFGETTVRMNLLPWLEPPNKNYLQRSFEDNFYKTNVGIRWITGVAGVASTTTQEGPSILSTSFLPTWSISSYQGPVGCVAYTSSNKSRVTGPWPVNTSTNGAYPFINMCTGYSPIPNQGPSISRVFTHPITRSDQIFSDPAYPATSEGTLTLSGTPTCLWPMVCRVRVTKSGDASDIVDEGVLASSVNTGTDALTVSQVYALGDIVKISTTDELPSPLVVDTDYYIIYVDDTHVQLATNYTNAQGGIQIDITTQGVGTHTLIRQNTAEIQFIMEPWTRSNTSYQMITHLTGALDVDSNLLPQYLIGGGITSDLGDMTGQPGIRSDVTLNYDSTAIIKDHIIAVTQVGGSLYTIQLTDVGVRQLYVWGIYSSGTSQPLFNLSALYDGTWDRMTHVGTDIYFSTRGGGIYVYDTTTPATPPASVAITNLLSNDVRDLAYDSVTGYLWAGHTTGLSKIDLGGGTATQYISGVGEALEGMSANQLAVNYAGSLQAYDGRIFKGGSQSRYTDAATAISLVIDDDAILANVKWYQIPDLDSDATVKYTGAVMEEGTTNIVLRNWTTWHYLDVTTTGKGTGSYSTISSLAGVDIDYSAYYQNGAFNNLCFFNKNIVGFYTLASDNYYGSPKVDPQVYYNISTNTEITRGFMDFDAAYNGVYYYDTTSTRRQVFASGREPIDLGYGQYIVHVPSMFITTPWPSSPTYGWTGSAWDQSSSGTVRVTETGTISLPYGVTASFNNSVGGEWDKQFVADEDFTFMIAPCLIKDNLQTFTVNSRFYTCDARFVENYETTVPASPYNITIPEEALADFKVMDTIECVTSVYDATGSVPLTYTASSPADGEFSVTSAGVFTFNSAQEGNTVRLSYNYILYS